ncbi:MAG: lectin-like protein [Verrucomicrobia bacterium]|nr:lectin-like protein [Verrucomicrobiota bacterium]
MKYLAMLISCMVCSFAAAQQPTPKPPFGVPAGAKLFNGKWYHVFLDEMDWSRAKAKCAAAGGQLVVIPDAATWDFVKTLTTAMVWLGATDEKVQGEWVWVDGSKMTFTAWGKGQPDNKAGDEDYLATWKSKWNDAPKNTRANKAFPVVGYICEWKAK